MNALDEMFGGVFNQLEQLYTSRYLNQVRTIVERFEDDERDWSEWGFNETLNDELYRFSNLHVEKNRIEKEIEQFES